VTILNTLVANGTTMGSMFDPVYNPAAPFYGWHFFTGILIAFSIAGFITRIQYPNASNTLFVPFVFFVTNLTGYELARLYLDINQLNHDAIGVFTIWIITFLGGGITISYKLAVKPQEAEQ